MQEKAEGELCGELLECRKALWEALHPYSMKLLCLSPAQFIHFGTTRELLKLMTEEIDNYEFLDWKGQILGVEEHPGANAYSNSYIEKHTKIAASSYIEDSYIFEVSSPGLGRPLKKEKDFQRSLGEDVEIRTYRPIEGQKEFEGVLKAFDKNTVTIAYEDDTEQVFQRNEIALIRLALDF